MSENSPTNFWEGDLLGRRAEALALVQLIATSTAQPSHSHGMKSFVLNVRGSWGSGKSFFLNGLERELSAANQKVLRIDAWRSDQSADPLLILMAAFVDEFGATLKKSGSKAQFEAIKSSGAEIVSKAAGGLTRALAKRFVGDAVDEIVLELDERIAELNFSEIDRKSIGSAVREAIDDGIPKLTLSQSFEKQLNSINSRHRALERFTQSLQTIVSSLKDSTGRPQTVVVIVDELDRCRPTYAIQFLERIHHLFDVHGMSFVIATDTDQLANAICGVYGEKFDSEKYLKRFFSHVHELAYLDQKELFQKLVAEVGLDRRRFILVQGFEPLQRMEVILCGAGLTARELKSVLRLMATCLPTVGGKHLIEEVYFTVCSIGVTLGRPNFLRSVTSTSDHSDELAKAIRHITLYYPERGERTAQQVGDICRAIEEANGTKISDYLRENRASNMERLITRWLHDEAALNHTNEGKLLDRPSWKNYAINMRSVRIDPS
jgi:hypothetical protein